MVLFQHPKTLQVLPKLQFNRPLLKNTYMSGAAGSHPKHESPMALEDCHIAKERLNCVSDDLFAKK